VEDWGFQAVIRPDIIKTRLAGTLGAGTPLDKASKLQLEKEITNQLDGFLTKHFAPVHGNKTRVTNVNLPWNRLFDISFTMECK